MAAALLQLLFDEREVLAEVKSAGVQAARGAPAHKYAVTAMQELGVDISGHRSTALTQKLVDWADEVLVVQRSLLDEIEEDFPAAAVKCRVLARDVQDPLAGPARLEDYRSARDQLRQFLADVGSCAPQCR
jgi:protein-tyrosine-phosphatase